LVIASSLVLPVGLLALLVPTLRGYPGQIQVTSRPHFDVSDNQWAMTGRGMAAAVAGEVDYGLLCHSPSDLSGAA
jgi:hypothetical protein